MTKEMLPTPALKQVSNSRYLYLLDYYKTHEMMKKSSGL